MNTHSLDTLPRPADRHRLILAIAGVASLANGAALVLHIVGGIPLPVLLAVTWSTAAGAVAGLGVLGDAGAREAVRPHVTVGLAAGIVATVAYDATKAVLAQLDPSPYNPFEVTRIFGTILVGASAPRALIATGVAWGLLLETFQLALYPGWLKIGFVDEFRRISFESHIVFGAGLALLAPAGLRRLRAGTAASRASGP